MRNIARVILWGLPPSFCALVQRAGRAARVMTEKGEAILIVPAKILRDSSITIEEVGDTIDQVAREAEAQNRDEAPVDEVVGNEVQLYDGNQVLVIAEGGVRIETQDDGDGDDEDDSATGLQSVAAKLLKSKKKRSRTDCNSLEASYLQKFVDTTKCRRRVWDEFFRNRLKR